MLYYSTKIMFMNIVCLNVQNQIRLILIIKINSDKLTGESTNAIIISNDSVVLQILL